MNLASSLRDVQSSVVGYGLPDFSKTRGLSDETAPLLGGRAGDRNVRTAVDACQRDGPDPAEWRKLKENYQQMAVYFHIDAKLRMDPSPPVAFETVLELAQGRHVVRPAN